MKTVCEIFEYVFELSKEDETTKSILGFYQKRKTNSILHIKHLFEV